MIINGKMKPENCGVLLQGERKRVNFQQRIISGLVLKEKNSCRYKLDNS